MLYEKPVQLDNYELTVSCSFEEMNLAEEVLTPFSSAVLTRLIEETGNWELQCIFEEKPDFDAIQTALNTAFQKNFPIHIKELPKKNWLKESLLSFKPVKIGRFYIYGSHITDKIPENFIPIQIDAATAFGSGEHQTTQGCLLALENLDFTPQKALDVGCGSGILSIAYAKLTHKKIDATDIDIESVQMTEKNAAINKVAEKITVWHSDGYQQITEKYDLIFCNILARPLIGMASDLANHLLPNGQAILSGFLSNQFDDVLAAHIAAGLTLKERRTIDGWESIVVRKN